MKSKESFNYPELRKLMDEVNEEEKHDEDQHVDHLLGLLLSYYNFVIGRHLNLSLVVLLVLILLVERRFIDVLKVNKRRLIFEMSNYIL